MIMQSHTRPEGSQHHAGGRRFSIRVPASLCGIAENLQCPSCLTVGKIAIVPGMPPRCLGCAIELDVESSKP